MAETPCQEASKETHRWLPVKTAIVNGQRVELTRCEDCPAELVIDEMEQRFYPHGIAAARDPAWRRIWRDACADSAASSNSSNVRRIMLVHRLSHAALVSSCHWRPFAARLAVFAVARARKWLVYYPFHVDISPYASIGPRLRLMHPLGIVIHGTTVIGSDCQIYHGVTIAAKDGVTVGQAATIGDNVYIGAGAKIIGPVRIGDGARIGANAVVTRDVEAGGLVYVAATYTTGT